MILYKIKGDKLRIVLESTNITQLCKESGAQYFRTYRAIKRGEKWVLMGNDFILRTR